MYLFLFIILVVILLFVFSVCIYSLNKISSITNQTNNITFGGKQNITINEVFDQINNTVNQVQQNFINLTSEVNNINDKINQQSVSFSTNNLNVKKGSPLGEKLDSEALSVSFNDVNDGQSVPIGNTLQRPINPPYGTLRYNTDISSLETYSSTGWVNLPGSGGGGGYSNITQNSDGDIIISSNLYALENIYAINDGFVIGTNYLASNNSYGDRPGEKYTNFTDVGQPAHQFDEICVCFNINGTIVTPSIIYQTSYLCSHYTMTQDIILTEGGGAITGSITLTPVLFANSVRIINTVLLGNVSVFVNSGGSYSLPPIVSNSGLTNNVNINITVNKINNVYMYFKAINNNPDNSF